MLASGGLAFRRGGGETARITTLVPILCPEIRTQIRAF
jgi:hypothetical protein